MVRSLWPMALLVMLALLEGLPAARDPREPDVFCGGECGGVVQAGHPRGWTVPRHPNRKLSGFPLSPGPGSGPEVMAAAV